MNGVTITRKSSRPTTSSGVGDVLAIALFGAIGLLVLPFLWLILLVIGLRDHLFPPRAARQPVVPPGHTIDTGSALLLRYEYRHAATISAAAEAYFEHEPVLCYQADPELPFFHGYFTNLRVERVDGLFVQKIHSDTELTEVVAMPLYFFCYQTQDTEQLVDLQDYEVETKGHPDDFILEAKGEQEELHIHLVREIQRLN